MILIVIGILVFLGIHLLPTLPEPRQSLIRRFGETGYRTLFAIVSTLGLILLIYGFARAPAIQVWHPPHWTRWIAMLLTLPAFVLVVASYVPGQIKAKLRHPFLAGIKFWALAHLIANGDLASILLFGSFLAYAVYDRIAARRREERGLITVAETGPPRNDIISIVGGVALWAVFLIWLHPLLIGASPLP